MDDDQKELAQRDARNTVHYSHAVTEIVSLLVSDLQHAGLLRPSTKSEIQRILREGHDPDRSSQAWNKLRERMRATTFQEQEMKRETPRKQGEP